MEGILEGLSPSPERDRHRGSFCGSAPGRNFRLAAINLLTSFLSSPKAAPGVLAIKNRIRARSGNNTLLPRIVCLSHRPSQQIVRVSHF